MTRKINVSLLFWISYFFIIFSEMFNNIKYISFFSDIFTLIGIIGLCLFILLRNKSYSFKFLFFFVISLVCIIFSYLKLNDFTVIKLLMLLVSLKNIKFDDFIKKEFCIRSFLFLMVFVFSLVGLSFGNDFFVRGTIKRYTLGFAHPNTTGFYLFLLAVEYLHIHKNNMRARNYFFTIIILAMIQFLTNSRTSFFALLVILLGILYLNYSNKKLFDSKVFKFISSHLFLILSFLIFFVVDSYISGNTFALKLNDLLSNRLLYYTRFIDLYKISLFGNAFDTYILDNSYLHLLLRFGVVIYVFYYLLFFSTIKDAFKKQNYTLVLILLVMLIFGLMENSIYKATYNIFLLAFSDVIFFKHGVIKNEK